MSRPPKQSVGDKQKRPEPKAAPPDSPEKLLLDLIKSKGDLGMWKADMKRLTNLLSETMVARALKNLLGRDLIKEVVNMKAKGKKHYMASEFEPAKELTGGEWYLDGKLDTVFIDGLKKICKRSLEKMKVATAEGVAKFVTASRAAKIDSPRQIEEILKSLVLGNEIIEVTSTGLGEYHEIPRGSVCYRVATGLGLKEGSKTTSSAMASIPCGVCPRISQCTPDGVLSPKTCEYYKKWLSV